MRAVFYCRISTAPDRPASPLDQQARAIRAWMATRSQVPIFIDEPAADHETSAGGSDRTSAPGPVAGRD
jgi:hypothetical protein